MKKQFFIFLIFQYFVMNAQEINRLINQASADRFDTKIIFNKEDENHYMPLSIINGKEKGRVFTIVAGIHGYEYPPIMAVQELLKEIDPKQLKGTLVILPIANAGSFYGRVPFVNPTDRKNLNLAFPGSASGSITEQTAHWITKNIIPVSDVFLDIHGGDANEDLIPFACYYNNEEDKENTQLAHRLSEVSGMPYIVAYPYTITKTEPALYAFKQAVQNGVAALSIEAGKLGTADREDISLLKESVYRMLDFIGMYPKKKAETKKKAYQFFGRQSYIKVPEKGIFHSRYKAGDRIKKGEKLGYITDDFGNIIHEISAPADGIILYKISTPPVNKGETMFCIAS